MSELRAKGYGVNHKVLERLNGIWDLSVIKWIRRPKPSSIQRLLKAAGPRINLVASLTEILDFEVLYTDITEIIYQQGHGKAKLMPIIDHRSKLVVGYAVSETADTELALEAWEKAKISLKRLGCKLDQAIIHHDQDGVYRGHGWLYQVMVKDGLRVSFSEKGAKDNVQMESFNGRLKEENRLLFWEQEDLTSLKRVIDQRIRYYNRVRRHSALGNKSPLEYLREKGKIPRRDASEN